MLKNNKLKPMHTDLDTAKLLAEVFGGKIIKDVIITVKGGEKEDDDNK